jgi:hypothetical protein
MNFPTKRALLLAFPYRFERRASDLSWAIAAKYSGVAICPQVSESGPADQILISDILDLADDRLRPHLKAAFTYQAFD